MICYGDLRSSGLWSSCVVITPTAPLSSKISQDLLLSSLIHHKQGKLLYTVIYTHLCAFPNTLSLHLLFFIPELEMIHLPQVTPANQGLCHISPLEAKSVHTCGCSSPILSLNRFSFLPFDHFSQCLHTFSLFFFCPFCFSIQVRCWETTTLPSSPAVR